MTRTCFMRNTRCRSCLMLGTSRIQRRVSELRSPQSPNGIQNSCEEMLTEGSHRLLLLSVEMKVSKMRSRGLPMGGLRLISRKGSCSLLIIWYLDFMSPLTLDLLRLALPLVNAFFQRALNNNQVGIVYVGNAWSNLHHLKRQSQMGANHRMGDAILRFQYPLPCIFLILVFMARNWETDKPRLSHRLKKLALATDDPMGFSFSPKEPISPTTLDPKVSPLPKRTTSSIPNTPYFPAVPASNSVLKVFLPASIGCTTALLRTKEFPREGSRRIIIR